MSPGAIQERRLLLAFLISAVQWGITFHLSCYFPRLNAVSSWYSFCLVMTIQTHHMCCTGGGNGNKWNYVDEYWHTGSDQSSFGHQIRVFWVLLSEISMMMMMMMMMCRTLPNISSSPAMDIRGSDILQAHLLKKPEHCILNFLKFFLVINVGHISAVSCPLWTHKLDFVGNPMLDSEEPDRKFSRILMSWIGSSHLKASVLITGSRTLVTARVNGSWRLQPLIPVYSKTVFSFFLNRSSSAIALCKCCSFTLKHLKTDESDSNAWYNRCLWVNAMYFSMCENMSVVWERYCVSVTATVTKAWNTLHDFYNLNRFLKH